MTHRERQRETEIDTHKETDKQRQRDKHRETETQRENRQRQTDRERDREKQREKKTTTRKIVSLVSHVIGQDKMSDLMSLVFQKGRILLQCLVSLFESCFPVVTDGSSSLSLSVDGLVRCLLAAGFAVTVLVDWA